MIEITQPEKAVLRGIGLKVAMLAMDLAKHAHKSRDLTADDHAKTILEEIEQGFDREEAELIWEEATGTIEVFQRKEARDTLREQLIASLALVKGGQP